MNWIGRKIHLYNVNIGLYMLDWWERYLFIIWRPSYKVQTIFYKVDNCRGQKNRWSWR